MFGETTISYVKIGNQSIETTIYKWLFGGPGFCCWQKDAPRFFGVLWTHEEQWDNWWADCFNSVVRRLRSRQLLVALISKQHFRAFFSGIKRWVTGGVLEKVVVWTQIFSFRSVWREKDLRTKSEAGAGKRRTPGGPWSSMILWPPTIPS